MIVVASICLILAFVYAIASIGVDRPGDRSHEIMLVLTSIAFAFLAIAVKYIWV